jgi:hypothetical protein
MSLEQPPKAEKPKSELEQVTEEMEKIQNQILAMDPDAPEMAWLKEQLQELDARLSQIEKPELRTPEHYGKESAPTPADVLETEQSLLDELAKKRKAS